MRFVLLANALAQLDLQLASPPDNFWEATWCAGKLGASLPSSAPFMGHKGCAPSPTYCLRQFHATWSPVAIISNSSPLGYPAASAITTPQKSKKKKEMCCCRTEACGRRNCSGTEVFCTGASTYETAGTKCGWMSTCMTDARLQSHSFENTFTCLSHCVSPTG